MATTKFDPTESTLPEEYLETAKDKIDTTMYSTMYHTIINYYGGVSIPKQVPIKGAIVPVTVRDEPKINRRKEKRSKNKAPKA